MTENIADWLEVERPAGRFDQTSIILHWLTVVLVIAQLTTAWLIDQEGSGAAALLTAHRSMGIMTWFVVVARLVWRHNFAYLPPFPATMPKLQQHLAKLNEWGLYGLLLLQPLTGASSTIFRGQAFALFAWQVPALVTPDKVTSRMFHSVHEFGAWALLGLVGIHAVAALFHRMVLRDGILQRMLP